MTNILDTVLVPNGETFSGTIQLQISDAVVYDGDVYEPQTLLVTVTGGALDVDLVPNDGSVPSGTSYQAIYTATSRQRWVETWVVPTSVDPVTLANVRVTSVGQTGVTQFVAGGAADGQVLVWSASAQAWLPQSISAIANKVQIANAAGTAATLTGTSLDVNVTGGGGGGGGGGAVTVADAADVAQGAIADAKVDTDAPGTVNAHLRGAVSRAASIDAKIPALGQALASGSVPVVLTAAQITALTPPAAISGFALESGGNLADLVARSGEVQSTPTVNTILGRLKDLLTGIVLSAGSALIGKVTLQGGAKGSTTAGDITTTAQGADHQAIDAQLMSGGAAIDPRQIRAISSGTDSIVVSGSVTANAGTNLNTSALAIEAGNLATIAAKDFATQTTLAEIKAKTDNITACNTGAAVLAAGTAEIGNVKNSGTFAVQATATIADGADVALGSQSDPASPATDTTAVSLMAVAKEISAMSQAINALLASGQTNNVPIGRLPGEGFFGKMTATGSTNVTNATLTGTVGATDAGLEANEYANFQIRIVEDGTTPTAVGQRKKITSHTAASPTVYTLSGTWPVAPSATAKYVVEGIGDIICWTGATNALSHTYAAGGFRSDGAWSTGATNGAVASLQVPNRPANTAIGITACWAFGLRALDAQKNARYSTVFSIRGGAVNTIDALDIATLSWSTGSGGTDIAYGNKATTFTTGTCGAYDNQTTSGMATAGNHENNDGEYWYINPNGGQRFLRFDVLNRVLLPWTYYRQIQGAATLGARMALVWSNDVSAIGFLYFWGCTQSNWTRIMLNV